MAYFSGKLFIVPDIVSIMKSIETSFSRFVSLLSVT